MNKKLNILVFTAHPDDHIPCVGTVLKLKKSGFSVYECLFTNGEASAMAVDGKFTKNIDPKKLSKVRSKEFEQASNLLGTKKVFTLNQPNLGIAKDLELYKELVKIIRTVQPFVVFIHPEVDYNPDHGLVNEACLMALRIAANPQFLELGPRYRVPVVLCFDALFMGESQILVDISAELEAKQQIVDCYKSQMPKESMGYKVDIAISTYRGYQRSAINALGKSGQGAEGFTVPKFFPIAGDELFNLIK